MHHIYPCGIIAWTPHTFRQSFIPNGQQSFIPNGQLFNFNVDALRRWFHCPGVQRIALIRLLEAKARTQSAAHALADEAFASRGTIKFLGLFFWARPKSADFPFLG